MRLLKGGLLERCLNAAQTQLWAGTDPDSTQLETSAQCWCANINPGPWKNSISLGWAIFICKENGNVPSVEECNEERHKISKRSQINLQVMMRWSTAGELFLSKGVHRLGKFCLLGFFSLLHFQTLATLLVWCWKFVLSYFLSALRKAY